MTPREESLRGRCSFGILSLCRWRLFPCALHSRVSCSKSHTTSLLLSHAPVTMASTGYQRPNSLSDFSSNSKSSDHAKAPPDLHPTDPRTGSAEHHERVSPPGTLPPMEIEQATTSMSPEKTSSGLQNTRSKLGLHPTAPVVHEHDVAEHLDWWWPKMRMSLKEPFAEFWGVFIMVLFGDAAVAQVLLSTGQQTAPGGNGFGNYQSINWGWGLGVMLGIYVAGDSGAYLKLAPSFTSTCNIRQTLTAQQPLNHVHQLRPAQTPMATLPNLLPRPVPRWLLCSRRGLHQLYQRHQRLRRRQQHPHRAARRDSNSRNLLHLPARHDDQSKHVL